MIAGFWWYTEPAFTSDPASRLPFMRPIPPLPRLQARSFLASTRLFGGLAEPALDEIAEALEWWLAPGGTRVFRQGEPGDCLYLVESGRLVLVRERARGEETVLGEKGRGDSLGELAILSGNPQTSTVRALRDTVLARLSRERTEEVLRCHPAATLALTRLLAGSLNAEPQAPPCGCVAVALTAASQDVPLQELAARLVRSLSVHGPTLHLNAREIVERFGYGAAFCADGSAEDGRIAAWISEQEAGHGFVLYEADPGPTAWTRRCLRQADQILVMARAGGLPSLGPLAAELDQVEADQGKQLVQLVLLHRDGSRRPSGTAGWLKLRRFAGHHHHRLDRPEDDARLARFLSGNAIGVVLGGGGARGFAHIGVLRALEEAGIPVDRIGGASMGASIAAQHACGGGWRELLAVNRRGWVEMRPHKVYTLPLISLLGMRKAEKMLEMMYGEVHIEDLWRSFYCVSTNLSRTEVVVHRRGSLHAAVRASMAIPGISPPVVAAGGDLLVDGGVLNNLPADVMRRLGRGPIIAVDVSAAVDVRADPTFERTPTPWQLLAERWRRRAKARTFPNILRLIHRSAVLASDVYAKQARREVELYLDLPTEPFDMFDVDALDALAELGYTFTREKLATTSAAWARQPARPEEEEGPP